MASGTIHLHRRRARHLSCSRSFPLNPFCIGIQGRRIVNERTDVSYLIEQFIVEPNVAGLRKALREMSDGYYNCEPNVFTATEARRRLKEYFDLEA